MSTTTGSNGTRRQYGTPGDVSRGGDAGVSSSCATQAARLRAARRTAFPRGPP
jgi:hypothetical protein